MKKTSGKEILVALVGLAALVCGGLLLASGLQGWLAQFNAWLAPAAGTGVQHAADLMLGV